MPALIFTGLRARAWASRKLPIIFMGRFENNIQASFSNSPAVFPGKIFLHCLALRMGALSLLEHLRPQPVNHGTKSQVQLGLTLKCKLRQENLPKFLSLKNPAEGKPIPSGADIRVSKADWEVFAVLHTPPRSPYLLS